MNTWQLGHLNSADNAGEELSREALLLQRHVMTLEETLLRVLPIKFLKIL